MARFDLYPGRQGTPYLLDVQSEHLDRLPTRMVVPLGAADATLPAFRDLTPTLLVGGTPHVLLTPLMAAIPRRLLGHPIGNLLPQADDITRAVDILLTGF
jgi:toxin CcdB